MFRAGDWICAAQGDGERKARDRWIRRYFMCVEIDCRGFGQTGSRWFGRVEMDARVNRAGVLLLPVTSPNDGRSRTEIGASHFRHATGDELAAIRIATITPEPGGA